MTSVGNSEEQDGEHQKEVGVIAHGDRKLWWEREGGSSSFSCLEENVCGRSIFCDQVIAFPCNGYLIADGHMRWVSRAYIDHHLYLCLSHATLFMTHMKRFAIKDWCSCEIQCIYKYLMRARLTSIIYMYHSNWSSYPGAWLRIVTY